MFFLNKNFFFFFNTLEKKGKPRRQRKDSKVNEPGALKLPAEPARKKSTAEAPQIGSNTML